MSENFKYGKYICEDDYDLPPDLQAEWWEWLDVNRDLGHWGPDKDRRHHPPKYYCDTFCPPHLCERVLACPIKPGTNCGSDICPVCKDLPRT